MKRRRLSEGSRLLFAAEATGRRVATPTPRVSKTKKVLGAWFPRKGMRGRYVEVSVYLPLRPGVR
jgi:hypothetical protein